MNVKFTIFGFIFFAAFAAAGFCDIIETNDGRKIEGKVIFKDSTVVRVKTRYGTLDLAAADIKNIIPKKTIDDELEEKVAAAKTADDFVAIAKWCLEKTLKTEAKQMYQKAVALDPKNSPANTALGRVPDGDEWVSPEEKKRRDAEREKLANESKGLVLHEGDWITKEEKDYLERGFVKVGENWIPFEEAQRAKGLMLWKGEWISANEAPYRKRSEDLSRALQSGSWKLIFSPHFAVSGSVDEKLLKEIIVGAEKAHEYLDHLYGGDGSGAVAEADVPRAPWTIVKNPVAPRAEIVILAHQAEYLQTVDLAVAESWELQESGYVQALKKMLLFGVTEPCGRVVGLAEGSRISIGAICHQVGHVLARRHAREMVTLPPWLMEAFACFSEFAATGVNTVFCTSALPPKEGTSAEAGRKEPRPFVFVKSDWKEELKSAVAAGKPKPFIEIIQKRLGELEIIDIEKGMGILEFLRSREPGAVDRLQRRLSKLYGREEISKNAKAHHDDALTAAAKLTIATVDAELKKWLLGAGK